MARKSSAPAPVDDYRSESDHGTMMRAAEIKADPGRMRGVKQHHKKQTKALGMVGKSFGGKR